MRISIGFMDICIPPMGGIGGMDGIGGIEGIVAVCCIERGCAPPSAGTVPVMLTLLPCTYRQISPWAVNSLNTAPLAL